MVFIALVLFFFFQAEDGIRDLTVTGVQTCALPIYALPRARCATWRCPPARSGDGSPARECRARAAPCSPVPPRCSLPGRAVESAYPKGQAPSRTLAAPLSAPRSGFAAARDAIRLPG